MRLASTRYWPAAWRLEPLVRTARILPSDVPRLRLIAWGTGIPSHNPTPDREAHRSADGGSYRALLNRRLELSTKLYMQFRRTIQVRQVWRQSHRESTGDSPARRLFVPPAPRPRRLRPPLHRQ